MVLSVIAIDTYESDYVTINDALNKNAAVYYLCHMRPIIDEWLNSNCTSAWTRLLRAYSPAISWYTIYFSNPDDAAHFKLVWIGV